MKNHEDVKMNSIIKNLFRLDRILSYNIEKSIKEVDCSCDINYF